MPTTLDVANQALRLIGERPLLSLADDCEEAENVAAFYDLSRREVFYRGFWNCLKKRTTLTASGTAPDWGYDYHYARPDDWIRGDDIEDDCEPWKVEANGIVSNIGPSLNIKYVADITDPDLWQHGLYDAVVASLALRLVPRLNESSTKFQALESRLERLIITSQRMDSREGHDREYEVAGAVNARYGGGYGSFRSMF